MKQDIRNLFKTDENHTKELQKDHRNEFIQKLNNLPKKSFFDIQKSFKIAVSILLLVSLGGYFYIKNTIQPLKKPTAIELQIQEIESNYLIEIDTEWKQFTNTVSDKNLILKYKERLLNLSTKYKEIHNQFKKNPNSVTVLEALISNLQTRVKLLKDIQQQLMLLQQKPTTYETIIL